jgi:hypothetical protein
MTTTTIKQVEPFADEAAERVVLASLLNGNNELPDAELFFFQSHRAILRGLAALRRRGVPADIITLTQELRENGELEKAGGAFAVTQLETEFAGKSPEIVAFELSRLHELRVKRQARRIGEQLFNGDIEPDEAQQELAKLRTTKAGKRERRIQFFAPSELRDYHPVKDTVLVGDCHIMRGETFVIAGEPSVGKSLAATQLAVSGSTQRDWFGLKVHCPFRTLIIQTENGRYRLQQEFSALDCVQLEDFIRVSEPPPFGLTLTNKEFHEDIDAVLDSFKPECVILDPWNAAARDDKIREYAETFDALRNLLPTGADRPALGIIAHTKKPQLNEKRTGGTALMHLLAGSYILTSVPRCIFVMTRGSQDETDDSVVFFNPKNSNGANAPRSAWHRKLSEFTPATDFDWKEFDKPPEERKVIGLDHIREVFGNGERRLELKEAAHDLATLAEVTDSAAYNALKPDGKFSENISRTNGMLSFHSTKIPKKTR